jgi:hypothetical protein
MHPMRREANLKLGRKLSGRQWRKLRKLNGFVTMKKLRRHDRKSYIDLISWNQR